MLEIEAIENRCQMQSDGKAEYYGFDRALTIQKKIAVGYSLHDQLCDDPQYVGASKSELEKAERKLTEDFLTPLECVDRYLKQFKREGLYRTISTGMSDREGRWEAFKDYSKVYTRWFGNPKKRMALGIEEDEIGEIEEAAFNIIRLRTIPDMSKVHMIMRSLPKFCRTPEGRKAIKKVAEEAEPTLPREECCDDSGKPLSIEAVDAKWAAKNKKVIIGGVKLASRSHETKKEKETPVELLEAAYKKLTHQDMDIKAILTSDFDRATRLTSQICEKALELQSQVYHWRKEYKNLGKGKA